MIFSLSEWFPCRPAQSSAFSSILRFVIAASAMTLAACIPGPPKAGPLSAALGKLVREDRVREVDLAAVWPLPWDEIFVFGPYSMRESNCQILELGWLRCRMTLPAMVEDGEFVLVFRVRSDVTRVERHSRWNGDFASRPQPIPRTSAIFSVEPDGHSSGSETWYRLVYRRSN